MRFQLLARVRFLFSERPSFRRDPVLKGANLFRSMAVSFSIALGNILWLRIALELVSIAL